MATNERKFKIQYDATDHKNRKLIINGVDVSSFTRNIYVKIGIDETPIVTVDFISNDIDIELIGIEMETV